MAQRTFRVFISSTFEDLREERDALQREVFPKLAELCRANNSSFQAIDLRWGVREEAGQDQKTMEICLAEIERCLQTGIRPSFVALLGDRYGWRPLPARIDAEEFQVVCSQIERQEDRTHVEGWYQLDRNAIPPEYLLKARSKKAGTAEFIDRDRWKAEESVLHGLLSAAARKSDLPAQARIKYETSATHQEILKGLVSSPACARHMFAFFREPKHPQDPELKKLEGELTGSGSFLGLPAENVFRFEPADLTGFCRCVRQTLENAILTQLKELGTTPLAADESGAQDSFAAERAGRFFGRQRILDTISGYLAGAGGGPLVVHGPSGSGKSAILAKASGAALERRGDMVVVRRFIGASPQSSDGIALLRSLCREIADRYRLALEVPSAFEDLVEAFRRHVRFAAQERPLALFVDGLDQLSPQDPAAGGAWLSGPIPDACRLIVSTTDIPPALRNGTLIPVASMPVDEARAGLAQWLRESNRTLQPWQEERLIESFGRCGLPLYFRLAFEEALRWRSYDSVDDCTLGEGIEGIIERLFQRLADEANHGPVVVSHVLGYLAAARYGGAEDEMLELLSRNDEVWLDVIGNSRRRYHNPPERLLPAIIWARLYLDLAPYLTVRASPGGTVIRFFHRQFQALAAERYRRHTRMSSGAHAELAAMLETMRRPIRAYSELPYQLRKAGLWNVLRERLTDASFLQGKAEAGMADDLLRDFTHFELSGNETPEAIEQYSRCSLLATALSNGLDAISEDPSSAISQLILELQEADEEGSKLLQERLARTVSKPALVRVARVGSPAPGLLAQTSRNGTYHHYLRFSPGGQSLLICDSTGRLTRWHWKEHRISQSPYPSRNFHRCGALLSDRHFLTTSDHDLWILEMEDVWQAPLERSVWRKLRTAPEGAGFTAVSNSAGGYALVAQLGPGLNLLLRVAANEGAVTHEWRMPGGAVKPLVNHMAISADGTKRAICFGDGMIALSTGWIGSAHDGGAFHGEFVLGDSAFLTAGADGSVALWNLQSGLRTRIQVAEGWGTDCLAWSDNCSLAAVGDRRGDVTLISLEGHPRILHRFRPAVEGWILSIAFSACGRWLGVGGRHGTVRLFAVDALLGQAAGTDMVIPWIRDRVARVELNDDGSSCYFSDFSHHLYSTAPKADSRYLPLQCHAAFALDPVRPLVLAAVAGGVRRLDRRTGEYLGDSEIAITRSSSMAVSPDGTFLVVLGERRVRAYMLGPDGSVDREVAWRPLEAEPRFGVPMMFLDSERVLFPLEEMLHMEAKQDPSRAQVTLELQRPEIRHRLAVFCLRNSMLTTTRVAYSGWCRAICAVGRNGTVALAIGDPLYSYNEREKTRAAYMEAEDAGVILYCWETDEVVGRLRALPKDEGAVSLAADPGANLLVASFRHGRVRIASIAPLSWQHSVRLPGFVAAVSKLPNGIWALADNGNATDSWPLIHHFRQLDPDTTV
ncbi:MAG: DUF4062 domain-containing protein [Acidobacteria bacterium]|nr:DUF4062 domain-containing protein [Acidobacteriota bacterium]